MNADLVIALLFICLLAILLWRQRAKLEVQKLLFPLLYFVMYKSRAGLASMSKLAKKLPRLSKAFGWFGIVVCFTGMAWICAFLIRNTILLFLKPEAVPGVQLVLPFEAKGVFYVPFLYWIIAIFVIAAVHEFSHGWIARAHKIPLKSSGFAFLSVLLPVVPAAFVEPDEARLQARPKNQQLSVFAAGPFSNLIFAAVMLGLFVYIISPALAAAFEHNGMTIVKVAENSPAEQAGLKQGMQIIGVNSKPVTTVSNFTQALEQARPGELLVVRTTKEIIPVELGPNPKNSSQAWIGIYARQSIGVKKAFTERFGAPLAKLLAWLGGLVYWLILLNIGIGLFNLLPIGLLDGGRMTQQVLLKIFKNKTKALHAWALLSLFFATLVITNIVAGFFK